MKYFNFSCQQGDIPPCGAPRIDKMPLHNDEELINLEQESEENISIGLHFTIREIKKTLKSFEKLLNLQVQI